MIKPRLATSIVVPTKISSRFRTRLLIGLALAWTTPALATIEVNVTHVGFPAKSGPNDSAGSDVIRQSAWAPVIVDLALTEQQASFDGWMRLGQRDIDGDECFDRVEVHLRSETGGTQRLFMYVPPSPPQTNTILSVELFDQDGQAVQVVSQGESTFMACPAQAPIPIDDNDLVILEITTSTAGYVQSLVDESQHDRSVRRVYAALTDPAGLPELWIGLEMVDYIVWEDAQPGDLSERQLIALVDWVRQGGTLLIAASRTAAALAQTPTINEVLPADIGPVISVADLFEVRTKLASVATASTDEEEEGSEKDDIYEEFDVPVPVAKTTVRPPARVVIHEPKIASDVITRKSVGRGQIFFSGVTIKDLFSAPGVPHEFFCNLFGIAIRGTQGEARPEDVQDLFNPVVGAVSFATSGTVYLFVAAIISVLYILAATFGVWSFLGRRNWQRHSWTGFAAVAVIASFLSLLAVRSVHGIGETLHQISMIDAAAGDSFGYGTVLFGIKTSIDKRLDVWLPSDQLSELEPGPSKCFLRPVPQGRNLAEQSMSFADPQDYRLVPGSAEIDDVRVRATLKRLQGVWSGPLGGQFNGSIKIGKVKEIGDSTDHTFWRVMDESQVSNNLGVDLKDCHLLFTIRKPGKDLRDNLIAAYPVGDIPNGSTNFQLGAACYRNAKPNKAHELAIKNNLRRAHEEWQRPFVGALARLGDGFKDDAGFGLGGEENALFLLSSMGDYDFSQHGEMRGRITGTSATWSRDRLRWLDLRNQLTPDQAFLIGFADAPGPIRLFRREGDREYRKLEPVPSRSRTMYRIRIPVSIQGTLDDRTEDLYREVKSSDDA